MNKKKQHKKKMPKKQYIMYSPMSQMLLRFAGEM